QAEDGIRDWSVTGVQTCALPISDRQIVWTVLPICLLNDESRRPIEIIGILLNRLRGQAGFDVFIYAVRRQQEHIAGVDSKHAIRSEERRVGKESRCMWGGEHEKE